MLLIKEFNLSLAVVPSSFYIVHGAALDSYEIEFFLGMLQDRVSALSKSLQQPARICAANFLPRRN